jgi:serine/threonine protein kinase
MDTIVRPEGQDPKSHGRFPPGTRLNDLYEIERLVAKGGMGEIYKGHTVEIGNAVAIKTIRADLAENEDVLALFRREASALHHLHHDAIVRYYVFSIDRRIGCPYLAMEFVEGPSLSDLLKIAPLTFEQTLVLMRRLAGGLEAAHEIGIFHRDVSPDNIILPEGDISRAKIIDFGIARHALGDGTIIGSGFAGKLIYVSPEQLGLFGAEVTARSDIYSFGLVLAHALLARPLDMGGNQAQVLEKRKSVPDLSGIDARLRPLIERMLQPDPAQRPGSMAEIAAWCVDQPAERSSSTIPRSAKLAAGWLAGAALLAGTMGAALQFAPRGSKPESHGSSAPMLSAVESRPDENLAERSRLAEEQRRAAEQEAQRRTEQERERARAEEERRLAAEAEAHRRAEQERARVEEQRRLAAEAETRRRAEQERARAEEQRRLVAEAESRRQAEQERARVEAERRRAAEEEALRTAERERQETERRLAAEREAARKAEQERMERMLAEEERRLAAEHENRLRQEQEDAQLAKMLQEEERRLAAEFEQRRRADRERLAQLGPAGSANRAETADLWRSIQEQLVRIGCAEGPIDGDRERVRSALERYARRLSRPAPTEATQALLEELRAQAPLPCG